MPRMWRMRRISHEGIHERGQNRTAAEKDQHREHQQDDDQGNQPPLLFLLQKRQEFFAKLPHTLIEPTARFSQWQRQRRLFSYGRATKFFTSCRRPRFFVSLSLGA